MILKMICGILGLLFGVYLLINRMKKHKLIDSENEAVIKEIKDLGRDDGRKAYAIKYTVLAEEPFEILKTPCYKRPKKLNKKYIIYYQSSNPKNNYLKKIKNYDYRLVFPAVVIICSIIVFVYSLINVIN